VSAHRPWPRLPRGLAAVATVAAVASAGVAACSGEPEQSAPPSTSTGPPDVYVAIGTDETTGALLERPLVDAWPRQLYGSTFDRNAVFVNLATEGATVEGALREQLPVALELEPTVVTVWLNSWDVVTGVPIDTYERQLAELLRALRRDGRAEVLVANLPAELAASRPIADGLLDVLEETEGGEVTFRVLDPLPPDEAAARTLAFNEATTRAAQAGGATVVDLDAALQATDGDASAALVSEDGLGLTPAGHARVAEAFADALER
jgi:lysophospholipase L1-like esterase